MAFDLQKFQQAAFTAREATVDVPALQPFFAEGEEPRWTVRGLTGAELASANEAKDKNRNLLALTEALVSGGETEKSAAIKGILGLSEQVPDDIARRLAMLVSGSVEPKIDHETAIKLAEAFPVAFYALTNRILELTGAGSELGKRPRSLKTDKSAPA